MKRLVLLALLALVGSSASTLAADKKNDQKAIQGSWKLVALEVDGKVVEDGPIFDRLKEMSLTFKDKTLTNSVAKSDRANFTLGIDKEPPTLDINVLDEKDKVKITVQMLYELRGDTLRLCASDSERPKEFKSNNGQVIMTLKRVGKK